VCVCVCVCGGGGGGGVCVCVCVCVVCTLTAQCSKCMQPVQQLLLSVCDCVCVCYHCTVQQMHAASAAAPIAAPTATFSPVVFFRLTVITRGWLW